MTELLSTTSIVPNAEALAEESIVPITDVIVHDAEPLDQKSIVPKAKELAKGLVQESIVPITDALTQMSIVPIAEALAQNLGISLSANDAIKQAGALLAFEAIKSAIEVLFPTIAAGMTFNATAFTLAMIQKKLDDISDKLDTLLEKDYFSALDFLGDAMTSLEHHFYEDANKNFIKAFDKATDAYNCAKNDDLKRIQTSKVKIFCYITTQSYDEDLKHFIPYESLQQKTKDLIASLVRGQIEKLLKGLTTVKPRGDTKKFLKTITFQQKGTDDIMAELNACLKSGMY